MFQRQAWKLGVVSEVGFHTAFARKHPAPYGEQPSPKCATSLSDLLPSCRRAPGDPPTPPPSCWAAPSLAGSPPTFVFAHLTLYYIFLKSMCTTFLSSLQYIWDQIMNTDSQWQKNESRKTYFALENKRVKTELSGDPVALMNSIINSSVT